MRGSRLPVCCSTGLSSHHSFCPLPASAHSTVRCHSTHPATGVWIAYCRTLTQRRLEESRWIQVLTHTMALSLPVFVAVKSTLRAKLQLEDFLPHLNSKAFPQAARTQAEHFLTRFCDTSLHILRMSMWYHVEGGEWNFVNYFIGDKDLHSNLFFILISVLEASSHRTYTDTRSNYPKPFTNYI